MKILVIDDEKPTLSMFRLFLTAYGYEVHTAENGEQGLALCESVGPDIVFTDIRMPGMDGLAVLARIKETHPACQVIVITGHGDMDRALEAMDLDASDFINKPVERQALNAALMRAEKRAGAKQKETDFSLISKAKGDSRAVWSVSGRLTGSAPLADILSDRSRGDWIRLEFAPEFSIDRSGMALLTAELQRAGDAGVRVEMADLGFNLIRFFEMAGIQKLAKIHPAPIEEPGL